MNNKSIKKILDTLDDTYPEAECALRHRNTFELIVAVSLSAQTTDVSVNKVTPALFAEFPSPEIMAKAEPEEIEGFIRSIGLYRNKANNLVKMSRMLVDDYGGVVPDKYEELVKLPGVGRKTANVVLSVGFGVPRIAVDTHVFRVSNRIGIVKEKNVLATEKALMKAVPEERWSRTHHSLIFHGRNICKARKPLCDKCSIESLCKKRM